MPNAQTPKYPHIHVHLIGEDGNAFSIIGRTRRALRLAAVPESVVQEFTKEATSGDYNHLLCTVMDWVQTDSEDE